MRKAGHACAAGSMATAAAGMSDIGRPAEIQEKESQQQKNTQIKAAANRWSSRDTEFQAHGWRAPAAAARAVARKAFLKRFGGSVAPPRPQTRQCLFARMFQPSRARPMSTHKQQPA